jgi:hypothetical protein
MATKYEQYGVPVKPDDPDAEYLTVQETAWVFKCSVTTIRNWANKLHLGGRVGRRIMLDRDERAHIHQASRSGSAPKRIPAQRRRKPAKRSPVSKTVPAQRAAA